MNEKELFKIRDEALKKTQDQINPKIQTSFNIETTF
jgi:hypothetical protein